MWDEGLIDDITAYLVRCPGDPLAEYLFRRCLIVLQCQRTHMERLKKAVEGGDPWLNACDAVQETNGSRET